jgi:hypothetical protein
LIFLLYFITFFIFSNFLAHFKIELHVHEIIYFGDSKNDIHEIWCILRPYPPIHIKYRASCCRNMMNNIRKKCF